MPSSRSTTSQPTILIATGASGGHIFPSVAVAEVLREQGFRCVFVGRGAVFDQAVAAGGFESASLPASAWTGGNVWRKLKAGFNLFRAFGAALRLIHAEKASVVMGSGGYASVAMVLAAKISGVPTLIQEQNVLPGRANRLLARFADRVCLTFDESRHYLPHREGVFAVTGNPMRQSVLQAASLKRADDGLFHLVVVGGSQGARVFSDVVPAAVALLSAEERAGLAIAQQARPEDVERVQKAYEGLGARAEVVPFFTNMPERMVWGHLLIGRSGTSTLTECAVLGRAALLVPLMRLADGHQLLNAKVMEAKGGAFVAEPADFTPERLVELLRMVIHDPARLKQMEENARALDMRGAAAAVAAEVGRLAAGDVFRFADTSSSPEKKAS